jgi:hypothetical protein
VAVLAVALTVPLAACATSPKRSSADGGVAPMATAPAAANESSTTSTTVSAASLVLSPDGLGAVPFGTQAARALHGLTQALGQAETVGPVPGGMDCGATRTFRWKNLEVLVNEASARSGSRPGLVGWSMGVAASTPLDLRTEKGVRIGSTVGTLKAAYGESVSVIQGEPQPTFGITAPSGVITAQAEGLGQADKILTLRAGLSCGA